MKARYHSKDEAGTVFVETQDGIIPVAYNEDGDEIHENFQALEVWGHVLSAPVTMKLGKVITLVHKTFNPVELKAGKKYFLLERGGPDPVIKITR